MLSLWLRGFGAAAGVEYASTNIQGQEGICGRDYFLSIQGKTLITKTQKSPRAAGWWGDEWLALLHSRRDVPRLSQVDDDGLWRWLRLVCGLIALGGVEQGRAGNDGSASRQSRREMLSIANAVCAHRIRS